MIISHDDRPSNSVNLLFWDVRSAINKMSEIIQYYSDFTANIGLLTETWQTSCIPGRYDSFSAKIKELAAAENYLIDCLSIEWIQWLRDME